MTHEQNLIWTQIDQSSGGSRIVGISGNPEQWVPIRVASSRYITAPSSTWNFEALGFDYGRKLLVWSDSGNNKIQSLQLNGTATPSDVLTGTSGHVTGLACDWLRGNVYWTDSMYNWIAVKRLGDSQNIQDYKVIVDSKLDQPADVVVDASRR